ncbi:MAG: AmmeMemoRadiSam system protein B [Gemmataceae bacterium]
MQHLEYPRLRPGLAPVLDHLEPHVIYLIDQLRLVHEPQRLTRVEFACVQLFDGRKTLRDIQLEAIRQVGGQLLPLDFFLALVQKLDEALFLDGPRFRERLQSPVREPSCIGCYAREPDALRRQLEQLFIGDNGPGRPRQRQPDGRLRAALMPHIDYQRGGQTFAWGFKEVYERTDASLFVIIGTSHYSPQRFILTRKDFKTPLGITRTDQEYLDRLVQHYGAGLFDDELAHLPEHSIELEVVFLQYLYENRRPIRIVPLLVGPFQDCVRERKRPTEAADIGRMIEALRRVEAETCEPICYIISGDLAHIGPKFGDFQPVAEPWLTQSRQQDERLMAALEHLDSDGYFNMIAEEDDRRRICGLPPTYTLLAAAQPRQGKLLHYDQYVHSRGHESVSFASMAFYR